MYRTHTCGELTSDHIGKKVVLSGWVRRVRDLGGLIFIDLRDRYGRTQLVVEPDRKETFEIAKSLGMQYVIRVEGKVRRRPKKMINPELSTGEIEVVVEKLDILNRTPLLPFVIEDEINIQEDTRLRWRFLDLRRPKMQRNIIVRHHTLQAVRNFLSSEGFIEIETPFLTKSTPEGARDFLVPSRNFPGKFYALPQSPQLYKQVLMSAGFDRYFQIVRCFRDEDLRQDRQPEFTQIDLEMSFVDMDDVLSLTERMLEYVFDKVLHQKLEIPFPRISYKDALKKYGSDKPDLSIKEEIRDFTEIFKGSGFGVLENIIQNKGIVLGVRSPRDFSRKEIDELKDFIVKEGGAGLLWFKVKAETFYGQLAKYIDINKISLEEGTYFVIAGDSKPATYLLAGKLREKVCKSYQDKKFNFLWVIDFPLFEWNEEEKRLEPAHHMFTMPYEDQIHLLEQDPLKLIGKQYDLVLNGVELASGSIRVHKRELQEKIMEIIGLNKQEREKRFGFLLEALEYGAPPHGGIAFGFDRLVAMMLGIGTIRDVIAFPKTTSAQALYEKAPDLVDDEQLKELHIKIIDQDLG